MQYLVVFEKSENSYGAYAPDLPGCVAVGETMNEVRELIAEAIHCISKGCKKTALLFHSHRQQQH